MKPVSILISSFMGGKAVELCTESIRQRTEYKPYKIVVYDSSGEGTAERKYLRDQESSGNVELLTYEIQTMHDNAIPQLLEYCDTPLACLIDSDVEIVARDWLSIMAHQISSPRIMGIGRYKGEGCIIHSRTYVAPTFQPLCLMLNMQSYRKIHRPDLWVHDSTKIAQYRGREIFAKYKQDFNTVWGDVGWRFAEEVLFGDNDFVMKRLPHGWLGGKIIHYGQMSSNHARPDFPQIKARRLHIEKNLKRLRRG